MTFFDDLLAIERIKKAYPYIKKGSRLLDIGCGNGGLLYSVKRKVIEGVGIDAITKSRTEKALTFIQQSIDKVIPIDKQNYFDTVTMLATLEHLENKKEILHECFRVLKQEGHLIITIPSLKTDKLIAFLLKIKILSQKEFFEQHKSITAEELIEMAKSVGFVFVKHKKFQLGYNNLLVFKKVI